MASSTVATSATVLTVDGSPTVFLPLPTAYPSVSGCAGYIYEQLDGHFLAWDPYYGSHLDTAAADCQAPQVVTWWSQDPSALVTTALGPQFVCPEAYSAVQTVLKETTIQELFCCPSGYGLNVIQASATFPSQCTSTVTPGQTISFLSGIMPSGTVIFTPAEVTVQSTTITVFGIPVNGFNFMTSSSSSSATTGTSSSSSTGTTTSSTTSNTATSLPQTGSSGTSAGVIAGATVAAVAGVAALLAGAFFLFRRRRRAAVPKAPSIEELPSDTSKPPALYGSYPDQYTAHYTPSPGSQYAALPPQGPQVELDTTSRVYEMPTR